MKSPKATTSLKHHHETELERQQINFHHEKWKDNLVDAVLTAKNALVTTFDEETHKDIEEESKHIKEE